MVLNYDKITQHSAMYHLPLRYPCLFSCATLSDCSQLIRCYDYRDLVTEWY
jgi:hypothetical protein